MQTNILHTSKQLIIHYIYIHVLIKTINKSSHVFSVTTEHFSYNSSYTFKHSSVIIPRTYSNGIIQSQNDFYTRSYKTGNVGRLFTQKIRTISVNRDLRHSPEPSTSRNVGEREQTFLRAFCRRPTPSISPAKSSG